ncbi:MAG: hypothetical protein COT84_06785 [Chlamydiae bacterium CG10_big_fil_rev_8_21_14_0_10_35_9]|nr:MAG: hypothetical protein COT84_06785 [Chlamydiae bacterium CG10_big_fil_rev_8_21_14_0_10_35_9]
MANSINSSLFNTGNNLPDLVRVNVLSHLSYIDQIAKRRINSQWLQASQSKLGKLGLIRSIQKISLADISKLSPQHINNLLKVLSQLSAQRDLDPENRILGGFLAKTLRYKCHCHPDQMTAFLESLTEKQRSAIYGLDFINCKMNLHMNDGHIEKIFRLCPNLRAFQLNNAGRITGEGFTSEVNEHPLISLRLMNCPRLNDTFLEALFSKTPHLKQIYFSGLNITGRCLAQLSPLSGITEVYLFSCFQVNEENLGHFFSSHGGSLKRIVLDHLNITGESFAQIPQKNEIEIVTLRFLPQLNENALKYFFSNMHQLKKLSLNHLPISGEALPYLASIDQLKGLILNNCSQLDEEKLGPFFSKTISLRELRIEFLNITSRCLAKFPAKNQLKILKIMSCKHLDETFLQHFFSQTFMLQKIELADSNITGTCFADFPKKNCLKVFDMSPAIDVKQLDENSLSLFFSKAAELKEFHLFASRTNGLWLSHIPNGNQLRKITIQLCLRLEEEHLENFYSKLDKINEITLMEINTTGKELGHLPMTGTLTKISLSSCRNMNLDHLRVFPPKILTYDGLIGASTDD